MPNSYWNTQVGNVKSDKVLPPPPPATKGMPVAKATNIEKVVVAGQDVKEGLS